MSQEIKDEDSIIGEMHKLTVEDQLFANVRDEQVEAVVNDLRECLNNEHSYGGDSCDIYLFRLSPDFDSKEEASFRFQRIKNFMEGDVENWRKAYRRLKIIVMGFCEYNSAEAFVDMVGQDELLPMKDTEPTWTMMHRYVVKIVGKNVRKLDEPVVCKWD